MPGHLALLRVVRGLVVVGEVDHLVLGNILERVAGRFLGHELDFLLGLLAEGNFLKTFFDGFSVEHGEVFEAREGDDVDVHVAVGGRQYVYDGGEHFAGVFEQYVDLGGVAGHGHLGLSFLERGAREFAFAAVIGRNGERQSFYETIRRLPCLGHTSPDVAVHADASGALGNCLVARAAFAAATLCPFNGENRFGRLDTFVDGFFELFWRLRFENRFRLEHCVRLMLVPLNGTKLNIYQSCNKRGTKNNEANG